MFEFMPAKKDRSFSVESLIGTQVKVNLSHLSDDKQKQYIQVCSPQLVSGWVPTIGKPDTAIRRKIKNAYLMEAMNGGRTDHSQYKSYQEYFNSKKKKIVLDYWKQGSLRWHFSNSGGDPDKMSLIVEIDNFQLESFGLHDLHAPEEWYSEMWAEDSRFKFERGFYDTAQEAIEFISDKPRSDLFGERYFPVVVFPRRTKADVRNIVEIAKSHSKPIRTKQHIIFGTRCKPYQYTDLIQKTYESNGQIAKALEWDWE